MLLAKLIWSLVMLSAAAYMQARARHDYDHGCNRDGEEAQGPLRKVFGRIWATVRWTWAVLFVAAGGAVWISWLWAICLAAVSVFPPLVGKLIVGNLDRSFRGRRK